jgi:hypothetical protein
MWIGFILFEIQTSDELLWWVMNSEVLYNVANFLICWESINFLRTLFYEISYSDNTLLNTFSYRVPLTEQLWNWYCRRKKANWGMMNQLGQSNSECIYIYERRQKIVKWKILCNTEWYSMQEIWLLPLFPY